MVGDSPTVAYTVARSNGSIIAVGQPADIRPYGIAVSPMYPELTKATQQAVQQLIDSGVYGQILDKWQIPQGAIKTAEIRYGCQPNKTPDACTGCSACHEVLVAGSVCPKLVGTIGRFCVSSSTVQN